ncbi:hypothetical protein ANO14919_090860 [Xylariales sp. No.14919]|nr:hypothetical protein ANO14919_090860 [Xylariales sp. No.14919]
MFQQQIYYWMVPPSPRHAPWSAEFSLSKDYESFQGLWPHMFDVLNGDEQGTLGVSGIVFDTVEKIGPSQYGRD